MRQDEENGIPEGIPEMGLRQQRRQGEENDIQEGRIGIPEGRILPE